MPTTLWYTDNTRGVHSVRCGPATSYFHSSICSIQGDPVLNTVMLQVYIPCLKNHKGGAASKSLGAGRAGARRS